METLSQILVLIIFVAMFVVITIGKFHRYIPALVGAVLTLMVLLFVLGKADSTIAVLNLSDLVHIDFWLAKHESGESPGINWQTIIFIAGMMVMVEGLGATGFFRWLCLVVAKSLNYRVIPIFIAFMLLSGVLSMFIASITVMLFLASVTIEISKLLKFNPVPMIIAEIFASNIGGSATMAGDPPNIIIGTAFGYNFMDFLTNIGPIALVSIIVAVVFFYFCFRKLLQTKPDNITLSSQQYPEPGTAITDKRMFFICSGIFLFVVVLLVTHSMTGASVGLIGVIAAMLTLFTSGKNLKHIIKGVDWRTLLFFIGLFVVVGGLEFTGALNVFAAIIQNSAKGNFFVITSIILWSSVLFSALVDNIPFAATMVPVISNLAPTATHLHALSWTLAFGTDVGGNATPIGACANVVGTAVAEREGYPISWGKFLKYAAPATVLVVSIGWLIIYLRYF